MAEFSKLNGYDVKDASARSSISDHNDRLIALETMPVCNNIDRQSSIDDYNNAMEAYIDNGVPIVFTNGDNTCAFMTFINDADLGPSTLFFDAGATKIIKVNVSGEKLEVQELSLDTDIVIDTGYNEETEELTIG